MKPVTSVGRSRILLGTLGNNMELTSELPQPRGGGAGAPIHRSLGVRSWCFQLSSRVRPQQPLRHVLGQEQVLAFRSWVVP